MSCILILALSLSSSQAASTAGADAATVPFELDHNRVLVQVGSAGAPAGDVSLRVWVDTGNPELWMTSAAAKRMGLDPVATKGAAPLALVLGRLKVTLDTAWPPRVVDGARLGPGLDADINLPSTVLRRYDLLIDFPARSLRLTAPGRAPLPGQRVAARVNRENGLVHVRARVDGVGPCELGVDIGATVSLLSSELLASTMHKHPRWPHLHGGVSTANMWGSAEEATWPLVRVPAVRLAGRALTGVLFAPLSAELMPSVEERAAGPIAGLLGSAALLDRSLGVSWASESIYLGRPTPMRGQVRDMDVVGLVLSPEPDGRFRVVSVPAVGRHPAVPRVRPGDVLTAVDSRPVQGLGMGAVWGLLRGRPGTPRRLQIERDGMPFEVVATVRHFLGGSR